MRVWRGKRAARSSAYRCRWFSEAPLRDGEDALGVDWIGLAVGDAKGGNDLQGAFVASLEVRAENHAAESPACAGRVGIEDESFNILETTAIIST